MQCFRLQDNKSHMKGLIRIDHISTTNEHKKTIDVISSINSEFQFSNELALSPVKLVNTGNAKGSRFGKISSTKC